MVDPRFIQDSDVLGDLDDRPNLMELNPKEFEALISNLFEKMGLDTRQTQASRDGGVDGVAWDHRPIFGGKVIIQAKRYKNTVGVSAVRDLFGTMQNEGASKGILVTTSGYGKSSFAFAEGKPLELLSGSNLLYLLAEHADIDAPDRAARRLGGPCAGHRDRTSGRARSRGGRAGLARQSAEVAHDPLTGLVQVGNTVLSRDIEPRPELRIVVEQAVEAHQRDPRIAGVPKPRPGSGASSKSTLNPESPAHIGLQ